MSLSKRDGVTPVDGTVVVSGGSEDVGPQNPRRRLVVSGILGGIAVILLIVAAPQLMSSNGDAGAPTIPPTVAQPIEDSAVPALEPSRLDILVDGYAGTLVLSGQADGEAKLWRWDSERGTPLDVDLPDGSVAWEASNADGSAVAVISPMQDGRGSMLSVLGQEGSWPTTRVTSFRWHSFDPTRLVWIDMGQDGRRTARLGSVAGATELEVPIETDASVVRYDSDGLLLQLLEDSNLVVTAVDLQGRETGRLPGRFVGALPDGNLLIEQDTSLVNTSRQLTSSEPFEFPLEIRAAGATLSPVGEEWAIWEYVDQPDSSAPTRIWVLSDDEIVFEMTLPEFPTDVAWSVDGRWLIASAQSGELWFIDTTDWSAHQVHAPGQVFAVTSVS